MIQETKTLILTLTASSVLFMGACAPTMEKRGNFLQDYQLAELQEGVSTRSDVLQNLGSPTTKSTFDSNVWYYLGQETAKHGILDPKVVDERVVVIAFNEEGVVELIRDVDNQRIDVPYLRDKTPTHGNEVTAMQQFFGNLGKFNPQAESASGK